jgi:hypothetical protein
MKSQGREALFFAGGVRGGYLGCPSWVRGGRDRGFFDDTAIAVPPEGPAYSLCGILLCRWACPDAAVSIGAGGRAGCLGVG